MRALGISAISLALTAAVISNAYYQKKQFYPSVVYITKSNPCMAVIYIQSLVLVLMLGKLMRKIFLGSLRAAEFEHLMERFWYALTETCLAFTVFRDDFNPKFVALFTVLLFLKSFHWLAEDRVDYMERSPVIGWLFHLRVSALLSVLGFLDYMMITHAYHYTIDKGPTVQLVFGFEYAILITMVTNVLIKYVLHATEMRTDSPWENKAVFLLYTELVIGLIRVILYVLFVIIMVRIYTLPLFAFRPMYYTMRNFKKALNDVILSRRAIRNMNTLYPDATPEELSQSDNICIICREDMVNSAKKLPCGHIFHIVCLRSWFQRQQTCPTCRLNILRSATTTPPRPAGAQNIPAANPPVAPNADVNANNINNVEQQANANPFAPPIGTPQFNQPGVPFNPAAMGYPMYAPQSYMPPPEMPPPPVMPPSLDTLTDIELIAMEGNERRNVEERIKLLKNIHLMLDASVALMNQYAMVAPPMPFLPPPPVDVSTASTSAAAAAAPPSTVPTDLKTEQYNQLDKNATVDALPSSSTSSPTKLSTTADTVKPLISSVKNENLVKIEDLGNDENDTIANAAVSTSSAAAAGSTTASAAESSEASELRRRRLQFLKVEQQNE